jgi:acetolactate synthase I/II/III large subunit
MKAAVEIEEKTLPRDDRVYFNNPNFVQLAESFSIKGMRVNHPSEIEQTLTDAFTHEDIVLVEIPIDNRS